MKQSEAYIIRGLKNQDEDAYKYLFEHHYAALCSLAEMIVKDSYTAETIVSDLFYHLWELGPRLNLHSEIRPYLATAVKNRCSNYLAQNFVKKEACRLENAGLEIVAQDSPAGSLLVQELDDEINAAIEALPDKTREVFSKSRFEGKSYAEIAEESGLSVHTVKYHMGKALSKLALALESYLGLLVLLLQIFCKHIGNISHAFCRCQYLLRSLRTNPSGSI